MHRQSFNSRSPRDAIDRTRPGEMSLQERARGVVALSFCRVGKGQGGAPTPPLTPSLFHLIHLPPLHNYTHQASLSHTNILYKQHCVNPDASIIVVLIVRLMIRRQLSDTAVSRSSISVHISCLHYYCAQPRIAIECWTLMIELFTCLKLLLNILRAQSRQGQHASDLSGDIFFLLYVAHIWQLSGHLILCTEPPAGHFYSLNGAMAWGRSNVVLRSVSFRVVQSTWNPEGW